MPIQTHHTRCGQALQAGRLHAEAGRHMEARASFEEALACAGAGPEQADAQLGIGQACAAWAQARQYEAWTPPTVHLGPFHAERRRQLEAAARAFEAALAIPDLEPDRRAQARYDLAAVRYAGEQYVRAQEELRQLLATEGVSDAWRVNAQLRLGYYTRYGGKGDPLAAYAGVSGMPGASPAQQADAHLARAGIFVDQRNYAEAHAELTRLFAIPGLPPASRARARLAQGKTFFLEAAYAAARDALADARDAEELPAADKAEAQLHLGLCDAREGKDPDRAGRALRRVLEMPGAGYAQVHEATVQLRLNRMLPGAEPTATVLFAGSSHTQCRNVPQVVELLAASAPAGRPRLLASQATYGGHTAQRLWDLGDAPETPRGRIAADPWDYLVLENTASAEYVSRFVALARRGNIRPILYETPVAATAPYPAGIEQAHAGSLALAKQLQIPLAPVAHAAMLYLGAAPASADRLALYHPDGVHTSPMGAYLAACALYATLTGCSPAGLAHDMPSLAWTDSDGRFSEEDAAALQQAAWNAVQASNPGLKGSP